MTRGLRALALVTVLLVAAVAPAAGREGGERGPLPTPSERRSDPKLDGRLLTEDGGRPIPGSNGGAPVHLELYVDPGAASSVADAARRVGGSASILGDVVVVTGPPGLVARLVERADVRWIRPASRPIAEVVAESVGFSGADDWYDAGRTGVGMQVAVIDLGFAGWEARRDSGELPGSVQTLDLCGDFEADPHGTAVAEVIHDIAPDARLHLICIDTPAHLVAAVEYAADRGITIVNHSVGWFNTGRGDGTGLLAPALDTAEAAGITWVNSAGNYGLEHWGGLYDNANGDVNGYHDFGPDDETLEFELGHLESALVFMRWDDWPSDVDYDLYLFREGAGGSLATVATSTNLQSGTQPPFEELEWTHLAGADATYHLAFRQVSGPPVAPEIDLFALVPSSTCDSPLEYHVPARSLNDAAAAPTVVAAGAVWYGDSTVECFSSRGPNIDGVIKPDLAGPDGVATVSYPFPFFGTSAAAPGVAGVAALLQETDPCTAAVELRAMLAAATVDDAAGDGPDNAYGEGILRLGAPAAVDPLIRLEGANRYSTAVAVSQKAHPCGTNIVYVATGSNHPDALAAGPAAAYENAPILLTPSTSLDAGTKAELIRLDPDSVVVLGGPAAISDGVVSEIEAALPSVDVHRRAGSNRYATAVEVTSAVFPPGVDTVFIVTGENFPDALGGAAAAVATGSPLLIVPSDSLPGIIAAELERLDPDRIAVLGGPEAVSDAVEDSLATIATVDRISAANRYDLSAAIAAEFWPAGARTVFVAVGTAFPDALAAGPLVASATGPLLLVQTGVIPDSVIAELERIDPIRAFVLGGPAAVSDSIAAEVGTHLE